MSLYVESWRVYCVRALHDAVMPGHSEIHGSVKPDATTSSSVFLSERRWSVIAEYIRLVFSFAFPRAILIYICMVYGVEDI